MANGIIQWCVNCSATTNGKYCRYCDTKEKREQLKADQELVKQENISKGFIYAK